MSHLTQGMAVISEVSFSIQSVGTDKITSQGHPEEDTALHVGVSEPQMGSAVQCGLPPEKLALC